MRIRPFALAAVFAATALSAGAQPRMESAASPFTYEVLGATPSLSFGKARGAKAADGAAAAQAPGAPARTAPRAAPAGAFTYDALGATPHVQPKKPAAAEVNAPLGAAR